MQKIMQPLKERSQFPALLVGSLGVVFGDIGTSPLYAMHEGLKLFNYGATPENIFNLLSLIFWTLTIVVSIKYISVIMQADNNGEGGSFALLALINEITKRSPLTKWTTIIGLFGAAFFFGDCMLTPAISVLSAIEGLEIIEPKLEIYVIPLTI